MGIDVSAVLIYGIPYEEMYEVYLKQHPEEGIGFHEWLEDNNFDSASPYFDSSYSDRVFGIIVDSAGYYSYAETSIDVINENLKQAIKDFSELTGKLGKLYISPDVT